jgi:hypothetical protein
MMVFAPYAKLMALQESMKAAGLKSYAGLVAEQQAEDRKRVADLLADVDAWFAMWGTEGLSGREAQTWDLIERLRAYVSMAEQSASGGDT